MSRLPLDDILKNLESLNEELTKTTDSKELIRLSKTHKRVQEQATLAQTIKDLEISITDSKELISEAEQTDPELAEMLRADITTSTETLEQTEAELLTYLTPQDPRDDNDILLEIRAGAGGDESSLFAAEMVRAYTYLCNEMGLKIDIVSNSPNPVGGYKEVICEIKNGSAFSWFKYEGGVHRVQRVPQTEKQGRIHTSTISVAIMPLIEKDNSFKLDPKDIELITTTSSGKGGQSVNTTYSAVKMKHIPTGIEAQSQDERNQLQNKEKALQVLTSRVYDHYEQKRLAEETAERRDQVGKADRSEKIRTYNFPQDRLTDHRFNKNFSNLPGIMNGKILDVIREIKRMDAEIALQNLHS